MKPCVELHPHADEVAVIHLPLGGMVRVHHPGGHRDYTPAIPGEPFIAVIPGDRAHLGWGAYVAWFWHPRRIRLGHHRLDRPAWQKAAEAVRDGGIVYVQYKQEDYHGQPRWTARQLNPGPKLPANPTDQPVSDANRTTERTGQ